MKLPKIKGKYGQTAKMCRALVLTWRVTWNPNKGLGFLRDLPCKGPSRDTVFSAKTVLFIFVSCNMGSLSCCFLKFLLIIIIPLSSWACLPTEHLSFLRHLFPSSPLNFPSQVQCGFQPFKEYYTGRDYAPQMSPSLDNSPGKNVITEEFLLLLSLEEIKGVRV